MKKAVYTITSLLLCVMFVCLMLFIMLEGIHILDSSNGSRAMVFTGIDICLLLILVGLGKPISKYVGISMYVPICVATAAYMLLAFGSTFALSFVLPTLIFTIVKLVLLFIFFCIIIPLAVVGVISKNETEQHEIKKHNI